MPTTVAVRTLCEFTAKAGDLDLRFTPSPTALEGMEGHAAVRARRGPDYQAELALSGHYLDLTVRGRADGYDPGRNRLEEIKTFRGEAAAIPANHTALHWAQARTYGHLLCRERGLDQVELALVYYDIVRRKETCYAELWTAEALEAHFQRLCTAFLSWAEQESRHRQQRDAFLDGLRFPYGAFRGGQRELAESVYKASRQGRCLLAQAPTGIGKTLGTLFPLLKACPREPLDKVFFLAAKTPGRGLAMDALRTLAGAPSASATERAQSPGAAAGEPAFALRILELVARDKACEYPDRACHGESCPLAQGFYDRLPKARQAAADAGMLDRARLRAIALDHDVCPYWLSQEMSRWCDVVVGDYNYYFDVSAGLHALAAGNHWRVGLLVDEAHNLLDRARRMYTAELSHFSLKAARQHATPALKRLFTAASRGLADAYPHSDEAYRVHDALPDAALQALQRLSAALTDHFTEHPTGSDPALQRAHFDVLHFLRMADSFGPHSVVEVRHAGEQASPHARPAVSCCIRNLIPAPFLQPRFAAAHSATLFSATLSPWHFHRDTLGLPEDTAWLDVPSPFAPEQLRVQVVPSISTRYRDRERSLVPIADLMAGQFRQHPGNYLSHFSSFDYLDQAARVFERRYPDIPVWRQSRSMTEADKDAFLGRFDANGAGIGFAVLGGAFSEGIDLPGQRLIGAFISTLGLPQVNAANDTLRDCMARHFTVENAYDYTYFFPGMQKVVQAAGRVIRTLHDKGCVYLIDDRYRRPAALRLLPRWWHVEVLAQATRRHGPQGLEEQRHIV